jgi:hypothetical protein
MRVDGFRKTLDFRARGGPDESRSADQPSGPPYHSLIAFLLGRNRLP